MSRRPRSAIFRNQSKIIAQTVTLKSTQGNLENNGRLQGLRYIEGMATGDILCKGLIHDPSTIGGGFLGGHEEENRDQTYIIPSIIQGGSGNTYIGPRGEKRHLSVRLQAGGKIDNDVSYIFAPYDISLTGQEGIAHWGEKIKYVAYHDEDSGFLDFDEEEVTVWKELVGQAEIISTHGRIMSYSPKGGVTFKAAQQIGADGDVVFAHDDIAYYAMIIETIKKVESSEWWGLSEDEEEEIHQDAVVTQIANPGAVQHTSLTWRHLWSSPLDPSLSVSTPQSPAGDL